MRNGQIEKQDRTLARGGPIETEIFVVDDDPAVRDVLATVFSTSGYKVTCFAEGSSLLAATVERTPACIILDVHIPGRSGLEILRQLNAQDYAAPIFMISGHGDIRMAVEAIKNGALDFIEKPFHSGVVVAHVREAIEAAQAAAQRDSNPADALPLQFQGRESLTRRERDVLAQIVAGASNKEAGRQLGISPRTVEVHRAHVMQKLNAKNAADLMRIVMSAGRN